jgi:hypothetical protein
MIELLVYARGGESQTFQQIKAAEAAEAEAAKTAREHNREPEPTAVHRGYHRGDVHRLGGEGWSRFYADASQSCYKVLRVRGMEYDDNTNILTESLRDWDGRVLCKRRYAVDLSKIPERKLKRKTVTLRSLKNMLIDKDDSGSD